MIPLSFFAFFFLLFSICSIWLFEKKRFAAIFFAVGLIIAVITSLISYTGFFITMIFCIANYIYFKRQIGAIAQTTLFIIILIMSFLLGSQMLPGFIPWQVVTGEVISESGTPFSLSLNTDRIIAGIVIMLFGLVPIRRMLHFKQMLFTALPITTLGVGLIASLALLLGVAKVDVKMPDVWVTWLIINLLTTCVSDEMIFRFFVQGGIYRVIQTVPFSAPISILLSTALFVTFYAPGSSNFLLSVGLGSLIFGYVYHITQRVEAAILTHFAVNIVHFFFFSYPMLSS